MSSQSVEEFPVRVFLVFNLMRWAEEVFSSRWMCPLHHLFKMGCLSRPRSSLSSVTDSLVLFRPIKLLAMEMARYSLSNPLTTSSSKILCNSSLLAITLSWRLITTLQLAGRPLEGTPSEWTLILLLNPATLNSRWEITHLSSSSLKHFKPIIDLRQVASREETAAATTRASTWIMVIILIKIRSQLEEITPWVHHKIAFRVSSHLHSKISATQILIHLWGKLKGVLQRITIIIFRH